MLRCLAQSEVYPDKYSRDYLRFNGTDLWLEYLEQQLELVQAKVLKTYTTIMSEKVLGKTHSRKESSREKL